MTETSLVTIDTHRLPSPLNDGAKMINENLERIVGTIKDANQCHLMSHALLVSANESTIANCNATSVMYAAFNAVQIGLTPGKTLGHCYFVPKGGECQLWIGFKGFAKLARQHGAVMSLHTNVVHKGEEFSQWADKHGADFRHIVPPDRPVSTHDNVIGAYCVAQLPGGVSEFEWMSRDEIDKCRPKHKTPVWDAHYDQMARKTVLKRAAKSWLLDGSTARAIELDHQAERGEPQTADIVGEVVESTATTLDDFEPADYEGPTGSATAEDMAAGMQGGA